MVWITNSGHSHHYLKKRVKHQMIKNIQKVKQQILIIQLQTTMINKTTLQVNKNKHKLLDKIKPPPFLHQQTNQYILQNVLYAFLKFQITSSLTFTIHYELRKILQ